MTSDNLRHIGTFLELDGQLRPVPRPTHHGPMVWVLRALLLSVVAFLVIGVLVPDSVFEPEPVGPSRENLAITHVDSGAALIIPRNKTTGDPDGDKMALWLEISVRIENVGDEYVSVEGIRVVTTVHNTDNVSVKEVVRKRGYIGPGESIVMSTYYDPWGLSRPLPLPATIRVMFEGDVLDSASAAVSYKTPDIYLFKAGPDPRG